MHKIPVTSELHITEQETQDQKLRKDSLALALRLLNKHGYLVLHCAVDKARILALKDIYDKSWAQFKENKPNWIAGGQIIGHFNVLPPAIEAYANLDVLGNRIIWSISSAILGLDACYLSLGGNTNAPGSVDQMFHSDVNSKDFKSLLINIPLGDVDESNGSIELIPKTHQSKIRFPEANNIKNSSEPIRVNSKVGSALIRYPHIWHRGKANPSCDPRHMLSIWHQSRYIANRPIDQTMINAAPTEKFLIYQNKLKQLGVFYAEPKFLPNYFAPNIKGLIKETIYKYAPKTYSFIARSVKKTTNSI